MRQREQGIRQVFKRLIGQCEQAMTWEEARYRVAAFCDENRPELADLEIFPHDCLLVAKNEIWPRIVEDRKKIYLGFQFL